MKFMPKDKWGRIPAIAGDQWSVVWSWPRGKMAWFLWGRYGAYRIGPITVSIYREVG